METILTDFLGGLIKQFVEHIFAYLGIAGGVAAGATYVFRLRYKKAISRSIQQNSAPTEAGDDVVNGNQTLINNNYYGVTPSEEGEKEMEYKKSPAPGEMVEKVEKLPPVFQPVAQKSYEGQHFQWNVKFLKLSPKEGDKVRIYFSDPEAFGKPMIYCDLDLKDHPKLQDLSAGQLLKVAGKLKCFEGHEMNLDLQNIGDPSPAN